VTVLSGDTAGQIRGELARFVVENFLFGDAQRLPGEAESLIESGVIDSTGILELIEFLESSFGIEVLEAETVPENLGSLGALAAYVTGKQAAQAGQAGHR
jgi:acyl carrier protein